MMMREKSGEVRAWGCGAVFLLLLHVHMLLLLVETSYSRSFRRVCLHACMFLHLDLHLHYDMKLMS